jgi:hypothetical protein
MDIKLPNSLVELPRFSGGIQHKSGENTTTHIREREISQDTGAWHHDGSATPMLRVD